VQDHGTDILLCMFDLKDYLSTKQPKVGSTLFIAVDGRGGSGKTTLAKLLSEKLEAEIIHTDDFSGWDNPLNWYLEIIKEVFEPVQNGAESLSYQPASWWENHQPDPVKDQPVTNIMILEGVSSSRSEFSDYISLSIFVDTPQEECLRRGVERDKSTGKSEEELVKMWKEWTEEENKYFDKDNPKVKADVVIVGTKPFEDQIKF
jgi:uridine kinase